MPVNAPKCKVCGSAHWLNEPHQFTPAIAQRESAALVRTPRANHPDRRKGGGPPLDSGALAPIFTGAELLEAANPPAMRDYANRLPSGKREAKPGATDRKAYMRAYMAKRRAKP